MGELKSQAVSTAASLGLDRTRRHIFLCSRSCGQACADERTGAASWEALKAALRDRGLAGPGGLQRSKADCLRICCEGPVAVVYPEGVWYTVKSEADVKEIMERHVMKGEVVERLLMPDHPAPATLPPLSK